MNKENAKKLWALILETSNELLDKLPDHSNHPKGRNPYAHVAMAVRTHFEQSYKDIPDEKFEEVVKYLKSVKKKPSK
ncbi:hypothetical protein PQZ42_04130 [Alphaproteobacteria bacterium]|nr:hypothetical protein [Alphaproteobacteria bacterium]